MRVRFAMSGAVALGLVLSTTPSFACFDVDAPPSATIRFIGPTTAEVIVTGLLVKAAGLTAADYCAVGLGHSGTLITGVSGVTVVDADDDPPSPVAEFSFTGNATTTADIVALVPTTPAWSGFHSAVSGPVGGGSPADLAFVISFPSGTTYGDLEAEIAADGLVTTDDATAGGSLAATSQQIEAISALTELPDCYNDVLDSGEVCDAASNLGCTVGDVCAACSACVMANPANKCKSNSLKQVANTDKGRLKCYAYAAKAGQPVAPTCLVKYQTLIISFWTKLSFSGASCPAFGGYPSANTVDTLIDGLSSSLVTALPLGGASGAWKCASNKFKAASLRSVNTLKCYSKAYLHNTTVDPLCLTKVDLKYQQAFTRAENPGLCDAGNVGNAGTVATLIDDFISNMMSTGIVDIIPPP